MKSVAVTSPPIPAPERSLLALTDQCVMCGLCLPHCPTYRVANSEAESPRGRIALAKAMASGTWAPSPAGLLHLDHCLGCLSCQNVCPSQVDYEEIFVRTRAALGSQQPGLLPRWLRDPQRLTRLARIGSALRAGRWLPALSRFLPAGSLGRRLAQTQPDLPRRAFFRRPARTIPPKQGRVVLFRGCVASVYDADSLAAGRVLLEALGHEVVEVAGTRCCGALPRHAGDVDRGRLEARATRDALCATGSDVVLVSASGCHGDLRDEVAVGTALKVTDILAFIAASPALTDLVFKPLALRAALHLPCTQVNVVGEVAPIRALLARIPQLVVLALPEQPRCCGAAGSYFLEYPEMADGLRGEKLDQTQALEPDLLLTTNIGCRIHLGNGLRERNVEVPVLHPLVLLAQQLDTSTP